MLKTAFSPEMLKRYNLLRGETGRSLRSELPGLARERRRQASLEEIRLRQELEQAANRLQQAQGARKALAKAGDIPFIWDIAFVEVFEGEKGGFHIVIGNPPYVELIFRLLGSRATLFSSGGRHPSALSRWCS